MLKIIWNYLNQVEIFLMKSTYYSANNYNRQLADSLNFTFAVELEYDIIANIGSRYKDTNAKYNAVATRESNLQCCACIAEIARSRANDAQNRLNRLICPRWFDSSRLSALTIVPIRAVDYARRNRLPFAYENPLCSGQVRQDYAGVGEKVLHRGPRVRLASIGDSGFARSKHVYECVYPLVTRPPTWNFTASHFFS